MFHNAVHFMILQVSERPEVRLELYVKLTARLHYVAVPVGSLQFHPGSAFTLRALSVHKTGNRIGF